MAYKYAPAPRRPAPRPTPAAAPALPRRVPSLGLIIETKALRSVLRVANIAARHFDKTGLWICFHPSPSGIVALLVAPEPDSAVRSYERDRLTRLSPTCIPIAELPLSASACRPAASLLVPYHALRQIKLNGPTVQIVCDGSQNTIRVDEEHGTGTLVHDLGDIKPVDYSTFAACWERYNLEHSGDTLATLDPSVFAAAAETVAEETSRYALRHTLFARTRGVLEVVTTDGRRLTRLTLTARSKGSDVHAVTHSYGPAIAAAADSPVTVTLLPAPSKAFPRLMRFTDLRGHYYAPLTDGHFPPYRDVIPPDNDTKIVATLPAATLAHLSTKLPAQQPGEYLGLALTLTPNHAGITAEARGTVAPWTATADLQAAPTFTTPDPKPMTIGINPAFVATLRTQAKQLGLDPLQMRFIAPTKPMLATAASPTVQFLSVIMPINLGVK